LSLSATAHSGVSVG